MAHARTVVVALLGFAPILLPPAVAAHESNGTPAARALFAEGDAAAKRGKPAEAAAAFRKAIDADSDFAEAHQRFIESTRWAEMPGSRTPTLPHLRDLYERWAKQHPTRAVYQWALGFLTHDPAGADLFFRKALEIDPVFARAHADLARNADLRGDWAAQRRHLKAAVDSNPNNPRYHLQYAQAHKRSDPKRFRELSSTVVEKFPDTGAAAEALYHLADASANPDRRRYFERLRANYPADTFGYAAHAMSVLYGELTAPGDALSLAKHMVKQLPASKTWSQRVADQDAMVRARALIADKRFSDALAAIEKTTPPSGNHRTTWVLLKTQAAAGAGHIDQAYTTLAETVAAAPDDRLRAALVKYGAALKKTPDEIDADIWRIRDTKAVPAAPFQLTGTRTGKPVALSDYRGRVVLLAFWFPG